MFVIDKFVETEDRLVVTKGLKEKRETGSGYSINFGGGGNVSK